MSSSLKPIFYDLIQEAPTGVCIFNSDWQVLYINKKLEAIFKCKFEEFESFKWQDWLSQRYSPKHSKMVIRYLTMYCSNGFSDKNLSFPGPTSLTFLGSSRRIVVQEKVYHIMVIRETTQIYRRAVNAVKFQKSFQRELKLAREIQKNINTAIINKIIGRDYIYNFYSLFSPSNHLSGDLMNIKQINRKYFSIFMGDGRGHGLPAALYSSLIYSYINLFAIDVNNGETNIREIVEKINGLAYKDFTLGEEFYFFSGVFVLVDGDADQITMVNGGHPHPFYIDSAKKIRRIRIHGPVLGVSPSNIYKQQEIQAKDYQIIVFYTDGLLTSDSETAERSAQGQIYHFLKKYMEEKSPVKELPESLMQYMEKNNKENTSKDDISILVMEIQKKPSG